MKYFILTLFFTITFIGCTSNTGRYDGEHTIWKISGSYDPKLKNLKKFYPDLSGKKIVYKESYIGNFSLLYTPEIINEEEVKVPRVYCYDADLDLPEPTDDEEIRNQMKCRYFAETMSYAGKPEYIFKVSEESDKYEFNKVVQEWYKIYGGNIFISTISMQDGKIFIGASGGACSPTFHAIENEENGSFSFKQSEVMVCS